MEICKKTFNPARFDCIICDDYEKCKKMKKDENTMG